MKFYHSMTEYLLIFFLPKEKRKLFTENISKMTNDKWDKQDRKRIIKYRYRWNVKSNKWIKIYNHEKDLNSHLYSK